MIEASRAVGWAPWSVPWIRELEARDAGHFGAYRALLETGVTSAKAHAVLDDAEARSYVEEVIWLAGVTRAPARILDIGCGPGVITNALAERWPAAKVIGVDASTYGIAYAGRRYPRCFFRLHILDPHLDAVVPMYDLIHVREFYPLTRDRDVDRHRAYLRFFTRQLRPGGVVLIVHRDDSEALGIQTIDDEVPCEFSIGVYDVALPRLRRPLPLGLAALLSPPLRWLTGRSRRRLFVLRRGGEGG